MPPRPAPALPAPGRSSTRRGALDPHHDTVARVGRHSLVRPGLASVHRVALGSMARRRSRPRNCVVHRPQAVAFGSAAARGCCCGMRRSTSGCGAMRIGRPGAFPVLTTASTRSARSARSGGRAARPCVARFKAQRTAKLAHARDGARAAYQLDGPLAAGSDRLPATPDRHRPPPVLARGFRSRRRRRLCRRRQGRPYRLRRRLRVGPSALGHLLASASAAASASSAILLNGGRTRSRAPVR